jgi:hypothetical protein
MSYIEQTRKEIIEAYVFLRTNNMTIPSETLEFMKDSSLKALDQALTIPVVVKPFYCWNSKCDGKRCINQCMGCEYYEEKELKQ